MKICVIGGGPSGLFLAKYLSPHVKTVTIYEKSNKWGGMYNLSHNPKMKVFNSIIKKDNINFIPNFEISNENFKTIEPIYDKFVIATGGVPNYNEKLGFISALDVIKNKIDFTNLGNRVCILGMGNVALDVCRKLIEKIKNIDVISRSPIYKSKFGNFEMRELIALSNIKTFNVSEPNTTKDKRRYELFRNSFFNKNKNLINLRFNTQITSIKKINNKYLVNFNNGETLKYDSIISSFGFKPNTLTLQTSKPVYKIGWCEKAYGNINDALANAKKLVSKILE